MHYDNFRKGMRCWGWSLECSVYTTCIKEGRPSDLSYYSSMRRVRTLLGLAIGDLELFSNYLNNEIME